MATTHGPQLSLAHSKIKGALISNMKESSLDSFARFGLDPHRPHDDEWSDSEINYHPLGDSFDPGYDSNDVEEEGEEDEDSEEEEDEDDDSASHNSYEDSLASGIHLGTTYLHKIFPFINKENTFTITLQKNSRGLGIGVTGGVECDPTYLPGLIRVKKVYPDTPAWACGQLSINDFILEANHVQLTGLTSHEALEVLRTSSNEVTLLVCRASQNLFEELESDSNKFDFWNAKNCSSFAHHLSPTSSCSLFGEFEVCLRKECGSLGFTLKKEDNSILGHTIRALVKDPAVSDGRIRPGDKLLSVNGTDMCGMSHLQAVQFLRTCPEVVVIRLYRDAIQTPVSPASPAEPEFRHPKPLRKEALDMLTDLAHKKHHSPLQADSCDTLTRRRKLKNHSPASKNKQNWDTLVKEAENVDSVNAARSTHEVSSSQDNDEPPFGMSSQTCPDTSEPKLTRPNFLDLSGSILYPAKEERDGNFSLSRENSICTSSNQLTTHIERLSSTCSEHQYVDQHATSYPLEDPSSLGAATPSDSRFVESHSDYGLNRSTDSKNALLKWKGILFTPEAEDEVDNCGNEDDKYTIIRLTVSRGWSSRLGFSLKEKDGEAVVSAIYADSVAAKDGRICVGDVIIEVNGEDVKAYTIDDVIDRLRKTPGAIHLRLKRHLHSDTSRIPYTLIPHS